MACLNAITGDAVAVASRSGAPEPSGVSPPVAFDSACYRAPDVSARSEPGVSLCIREMKDGTVKNSYVTEAEPPYVHPTGFVFGKEATL